MKIKFREPEFAKYIHIDPATYNVHLLVPITAGSVINMENTCQSGGNMKRFFGKSYDAANPLYRALNSLEHYKRALTHDIRILSEGDPIQQAKAKRLQQIEHYIQTVRTLESHSSMNVLNGLYPLYPDAINELMKERKNLFGMRLMPHGREPDAYLRTVTPIFCQRSLGNEDIHLPEPTNQHLYERLSSVCRPTHLNIMSKKKDFASQVAQSLEQCGKARRGDDGKHKLTSSGGLSDIQSMITDKMASIYPEAGAVNLSEDSYGQHIDEDYVENTLCLDGNEPVEDYVDELIKACMNEFWESLDETPFVRVMRLTQWDLIANMVQFLLAEINIYCYAHGLSERDFGQILSDSYSMSNTLALAVKNAIEQGQCIEDVVIDFINRHAIKFGLVENTLMNRMRRHNVFDTNARATIKNKFSKHFNAIYGSPHYDEFMILYLEKPGSFFSHQGSICCDFSKFVGYYPELDNGFYRELRENGSHLQGDIDSGNECIEQHFEVDDEAFAHYLLQLANDQVNLDTLARLLLSETESGQRVFELISNDTAARLKFSLNWQELKSRLSQEAGEQTVLNSVTERFASLSHDDISEDYLSGPFPSATFSDQAQDNSSIRQLIITQQIQDCLYVAAVKFYGFAPCEGCDNAQELPRLLQLLGIQAENIERAVTGNNIVHCTSDIERSLQEIISNNQQQMYISTDMAAKFYITATQRYGESSEQIREMNELHNSGIVPYKMLKALELLDIPITREHVSFPGDGIGGYIFEVTPAIRQTINDIQLANSLRHLTSEMAAALYREVEARGYGNEINSLSNEHTPDKIQRTLELLQIPFDHLSFNYHNGYLVRITSSALERVEEIVESSNSDTASSIRASQTALRTTTHSARSRNDDTSGEPRMIRSDRFATFTSRSIGQRRSIAIPRLDRPEIDSTVSQTSTIGDVGLAQDNDEMSCTSQQETSEISTTGQDATAQLSGASMADETATSDSASTYQDATAQLSSASVVDETATSDSTSTYQDTTTQLGGASITEATTEAYITIKRVSASDDTAESAEFCDKVELHCPDTILQAFRNIVAESDLQGAVIHNEYTQEFERLPTQVQDFTARHLQILARNEARNTTGYMDTSLYRGLLTDNQIAAIRCLVKATVVAGTGYAHHYGGFGIAQNQIPPEKVIIVDQAGLQWQGDLRNTGSMAFYPTNPEDSGLPENYSVWQGQLFSTMHGSERPETQSENSVYVSWNGVQGFLDLSQVANLIRMEFRQALHAAVAQGNKVLTAEEKINFKFLKAGMGFFSSGLWFEYGDQIHSKAKLEYTRLEGIAQALDEIIQLPEQERIAALGYVKALTLPFSDHVDGMRNDTPYYYTDKLEEIKTKIAQLGLEWGGADSVDALYPTPGYVNAITNCGDPHAGIGNEGNCGSVDAAIACNVYLYHLNTAFNNQVVIIDSPDFIRNIESDYEFTCTMVMKPEQGESIESLLAVEDKLKELILYYSSELSGPGHWRPLFSIDDDTIEVGQSRHNENFAIASSAYHAELTDEGVNLLKKYDGWTPVTHPVSKTNILKSILDNTTNNIPVLTQFECKLRTYCRLLQRRLETSGSPISSDGKSLRNCCERTGIAVAPIWYNFRNGTLHYEDNIFRIKDGNYRFKIAAKGGVNIMEFVDTRGAGCSGSWQTVEDEGIKTRLLMQLVECFSAPQQAAADNEATQASSTSSSNDSMIAQTSDLSRCIRYPGS